MPVVTCRSCRATFRPPPSVAGKSAPCPGCGAAVRVPPKPPTDSVPLGQETPSDPGMVRGERPQVPWEAATPVVPFRPLPRAIGDLGSNDPTPVTPVSVRRWRTAINFARPPRPRMSVWVWVAVGAGVAGLIAATVLAAR